MAYNRLAYQPYEDASQTLPYGVGFPSELPYPEDIHPQNLPDDAYNYQMNPYGEPQYPPDYHPRRDGYDYPPSRPFDYDDGSVIF